MEGGAQVQCSRRCLAHGAWAVSWQCFDYCGLGGVGHVAVFPLAGSVLSAVELSGLDPGLEWADRSLTWYASMRVPREASSQNMETSISTPSSPTQQ